MTSRCQLCGEFENGQTTICTAAGDVCYECISNLVENEVERRGVRAQEGAFREYHSGNAPYPFTDSERQEEQARIQRELK